MRLPVLFIGAVILTLSAAMFTSCTTKPEKAAADTTYTVSVKMSGLDTGTLLLSYRSNEENITDTAVSTNGEYVFTGKSQEPRKAYLRVKDLRVRSLSFYLENGNILIHASKDSLASGKVTGTVSNEENTRLNLAREATNYKMRTWEKAYEGADKSDKALMDSLEDAYDVLDKEMRNSSLQFIAANPSSYVSAYEINEIFIYNPDVPAFDSAFNLLDSAIRVSAIGKEISERLDIAKRTDINQLAPDFTLNDVNGKPIALSSLRGNYLLIDFWASWCGPCRRENPNLVKAYKTYNKKGFEIVGVSLDYPGDKEKWLGAIKKDGLTWLQLSDLQGWQCAAARQYGIMAIPMNFLLDPEGRVVAKGLTGADLEAKLMSLLSTPSASN